jgi:predicted P-loop ATPase
MSGPPRTFFDHFSPSPDEQLAAAKEAARLAVLAAAAEAESEAAGASEAAEQAAADAEHAAEMAELAAPGHSSEAGYKAPRRDAPRDAPRDGVVRPLRAVSTPAWQGRLMLTDKKKPMRTISNALVALRGAAEWQGLFRWCEFSQRVLVTRPLPEGVTNGGGEYPRELIETDITQTAGWLERRGIMIGTTTAKAAIGVVAEEHPHHPVREYLASLAWDGVERLSLLLVDHLGARDGELTRVFTRKWFIGLVARVMIPGCKFDTALILEGRQGIGKSSFLEILTRPWFTDQLPDLTRKDALEQLQGVWCVEVSEFATFDRATAAHIKSFISSSTDRFRPSFGSVARNFPRQCGFAATLNPVAYGYLRDETGGRRFWPVACGADWDHRMRLDRASLAAVRDQVWAEVMTAFHAHESWHLETVAQETQHAAMVVQRGEDDPLDSEIEAVLARMHHGVTMAEILGPDGLAVPRERWHRALQIAVGRALTRYGWTKYRESSGKVRPWRYKPPFSEPESEVAAFLAEP